MKSVLKSRAMAANLCAALISFFIISASGQTNDAPKILFLHVRIEQGKRPELIESSVRDGELKPALKPEQADGIHYELLSKDGKSLWRGAVTDPSRKIVEYEDPPRSGKLKRKNIETADTEFTLRVPFTTNAHRVEFFTLVESRHGGIAQTNKLGAVIVQTK